MSIRTIDHHGWKNSLLLSNPHIEAVLTTDVGPRVVSLRTPGGTEVFKSYPEQLGRSGEAEWMIRGGHRIWIAPEHESMTYGLDNEPVAHRIEGTDTVRFTNPGIAPWNLRKELSVTIAPDRPALTVVHTLHNDGTQPQEVASWGLSVMAPGGVEILPLPPLGEHPRDLLPNRVMIAWPYTDLSDPRWKFGRRFILLRQSAERGPTKLGLRHTQGWAGYLLGDALFLKTVHHDPSDTYTDLGCNFETFTNPEMLEIETLGRCAPLAPGASTSHTEHWFLKSGLTPPTDLEDEDRLAAWLAPLLREAGF